MVRSSAFSEVFCVFAFCISCMLSVVIIPLSRNCLYCSFLILLMFVTFVLGILLLLL